jgi:hypothetical protein
MLKESKTTAWSFAVELMVQGITPPGVVKADFLAAMGLASSNQGKMTRSGSGVPPSRSGRWRDRSSEGLQCNFSCFLGFSASTKLYESVIFLASKRDGHANFSDRKKEIHTYINIKTVLPITHGFYNHITWEHQRCT